MLAAALLLAGMPAAAGSAALSERVVAYTIDARVDAQQKTVEGDETLVWRNLTGKPQTTFPFHLYLNAFQPQATFVEEMRRDDEGFDWDPKYRASATVTRFEVTGMGDLTSKMRFVAPDDGNANDKTVFEVTLPKPVAPGESVEFKIRFKDQLGEVLARTGYKHDFIMGAQWFPKIGVWWKDRFNCHQFHADTEFFADFGTFDVRLTAPQSEVVGASGVEIGREDHADGTRTIHYRGEDIHDFAWTMEPQYKVVEDSFTGSAGRVKIRVLMQPGHMASAPRYVEALKGTMERFDRWYGPYPYPQITVVDPPPGGVAAGGMEYPMLITADTAWWMPVGLRLPEDVVEHEFGHQYWYGMVATNEFEEAWLDEGINSYSEVKVMNDMYGDGTSMLNLWGVTAGVAEYERAGYGTAVEEDPLARFAYQYLDSSSYGTITYGKTTLMMLTLEKLVGETTLRDAMRTYFERYRFKHPTGEDFLKTVEEVSGKDLRWYFDQAVYGTQVLDYEIKEVRAERADWYEDDPREEKPGQTSYRNTVVVHRKGDFVFPVDVRVRFENGEHAVEHWDGRDRWVRYTYDKKSKVTFATVDPQRALWLDRNLMNNSYAMKPEPRMREKVAGYWTVIVQFLGQWLAWLA